MWCTITISKCVCLCFHLYMCMKMHTNFMCLSICMVCVSVHELKGIHAFKECAVQCVLYVLVKLQYAHTAIQLIENHMTM